MLEHLNVKSAQSVHSAWKDLQSQSYALLDFSMIKKVPQASMIASSVKLASTVLKDPLLN